MAFRDTSHDFYPGYFTNRIVGGGLSPFYSLPYFPQQYRPAPVYVGQTPMIYPQTAWNGGYYPQSYYPAYSPNIFYGGVNFQGGSAAGF